MLTVNELEHVERPAGTLILQSMRSHDQFNTTIYGNNDRYRGIKKGREVVFVSPEDLAELGLSDGQHVDIHGVYTDNVERVLRNFRVVLLPHGPGLRCRLLPGGQRAGSAGQRRGGQPDAGVQGRDRAAGAGAGA